MLKTKRNTRIKALSEYIYLDSYAYINAFPNDLERVKIFQKDCKSNRKNYMKGRI